MAQHSPAERPEACRASITRPSTRGWAPRCRQARAAPPLRGVRLGIRILGLHVCVYIYIYVYVYVYVNTDTYLYNYTYMYIRMCV